MVVDSLGSAAAAAPVQYEPLEDVGARVPGSSNWLPSGDVVAVLLVEQKS